MSEQPITNSITGQDLNAGLDKSSSWALYHYARELESANRYLRAESEAVNKRLATLMNLYLDKAASQ